MKKNAKRYYQSALYYHLPVEPLPDLDGFLVHIGKKNYYFFERSTPFNNMNSHRLALHKYYTSYFLAKAGIPVPAFVAISKQRFDDGMLEEDIAELEFPLVAKPMMATGFGDDVFCNIQTIQQLQEHLQQLFERYSYVNVEEYHGNLKSYRVLVFKQKVIGVVYRRAAFVEGDGVHSIRELIEMTNQKRQQQSEILKPIVHDMECEISLQKLSMTLDSVPKSGEEIPLGFTSNSSRGGTFKSIGKTICRENKAILLKAAKILDLDIAGIDVECEDINIPFSKSEGVVIEVNSSPSVRVHEESFEGKPVAVTRTIMRSLIFKHPFAYCWILFNHRQTRPYIRAIIILIVFLGIFVLIR